ncbi:MAG: ABC transporter ATP-binding protein/permease [Firmicutes bacterium]|nr:ABC transporter ATP-binding protein/permease [[Eubacterium] siraeum]MCM1488548.1 ABC transporter ATP-binding protein/permease [Bacillota bacterium]
MLQLKNVVKKYGEKENQVTALNGVSISFRENEFVAILGHSGCGKTTMLNIIGGLDHCTEGDLIINNVSTKKFKDRDWDAYRNHSIGFIFQSYNLIPHQTVLANVELALTISGISKSERKKRATEALKKVGLGDQLHKRPNQMSGGQMQRVAIARALINNPDILLADEPTGALDSETSIQVMELLKEIAKDRLVILVTHNPELAEQYATRIVRVKDGNIVSDSDPFDPPKAKEEVKAKKKRVSMSFFTAVSLSLNNLLTKKGRTLLTSFAGSIGIIGIALILSLSTGINNYINAVQEETLSSYPISIEKETTDLGGMFSTIMDRHESDDGQEDADASKEFETVRANTDVYEVFNALNSSAKQTNNMKAFKEYVDSCEEIQSNASAVSYSYNTKLPIYTDDAAGNIIKSDLMETMTSAWGYDGMSEMTSSSTSSLASASMSGMDMWEEMLPADNGEGINEILYNQYDLIYGSWPQNYDEVVLILTRRNELPDIVTFALGLKDTEVMPDLVKKVMTGEVVEDYGQTEWTYQELCDKEFKLILPCEYYQKSEGGTGYIDLTENETGLEYLYNSEDIGLKLKITGFIRPNENATSTMLQGYLGYTKALTDYVINKTNQSDIVKAQLDDPDTDVILGLPFKTDDYAEPSDAEKSDKVNDFLKGIDNVKKAEIYKYIMSIPDSGEMEAYVQQYLAQVTREDIEAQVSANYAQSMGVDAESILSYIGQMSDDDLFGYAGEAIAEQYKAQYGAMVEQQLAAMTIEQLAAALDMAELNAEQYGELFEEYTPDEFSNSSYDSCLSLLGYADFDDPTSIRIYAKTFRDKDAISEAISAYNDSVSEENEIKYTDYVALLMSSITDIISGISYLLIAFVSISLVVSSIMIGIITYISVLERTREIGILRAIGASKKDISTVFNAETLIVGLVSGAIGIGVTLLLIIPINIILYSATGIEGLKAVLPPVAAVILVVISMILTLIAGVIPSRVAAKKDPVEALRTE